MFPTRETHGKLHEKSRLNLEVKPSNGFYSHEMPLYAPLSKTMFLDKKMRHPRTLGFLITHQ